MKIETCSHGIHVAVDIYNIYNIYIIVDQILSVEQDSVRSKLDLTGLNLGDGSDGKEEQESQIRC